MCGDDITFLKDNLLSLFILWFACQYFNGTCENWSLDSDLIAGHIYKMIGGGFFSYILFFDFYLSAYLLMYGF